MALALQSITGQWKRINTVPYTGAAVWGTGINPVHQFYGSDAARIAGRTGTQGSAGYGPGEKTPPFAASPDFVQTGEPWGYQPEDLAGLDVFADPEVAIHGIYFDQDGWPDWTEQTPQTRANTDLRAIYPVGAPGLVADTVRGVRYGPRDDDSEVSNEIPTETVSEGWENKLRGQEDLAQVSDPAQYERQTSMQQRFAVRNNRHAVQRGTDAARTPIGSREAGQKIKPFSGEQRHYDMFPFQQDVILRPFSYRTAGVGRAEWMRPNEMFVASPLTRTPPPDPAMGPEDFTLSDQFGYTGEDQFYA